MKKAEQEKIKRLQDSEEKYRKMFQLASDAIFNIDTETGTIVEANLKAEEMTGYSLSELQGMKAWELHPEYEREKAIFLFEKVRSDECQLSCNLSIRKKDGTLIETDINATTISYGNKKIIQRICRDITDRRLLEERNKYLKEYFEHTLNMMPVGLGVIKNINKNPEVEFENKKLKEMFPQSAKKGSGGFKWYDRSAQNIV
ncbi:MAG: PAS domain-containing protein, partial [Calditrichia bacterium]